MQRNHTTFTLFPDLQYSQHTTHKCKHVQLFTVSNYHGERSKDTRHLPSPTLRNGTGSQTQRCYQQNHEREHDQSDIHAYKNIHLPKDKREFEYLTLDSMEIITRGEGIPFELDTETIEKLNSLASSETSKLFCPSYTKTKAKRKQGRPRKPLHKARE